jgi:hypothetical protein
MFVRKAWGSIRLLNHGNETKMDHTCESPGPFHEAFTTSRSLFRQ